MAKKNMLILTPEKLNNGYYLIKNDKGQVVMNKEYNAIMFETKKRALFFINTLQAIFRDSGKIPYEFKY